MPRILLVENDPSVAESVNTALQGGEYQIERADRAESVLQGSGLLPKGSSLSEGSASSCDALITGWILPGINGPEFAKQLREEGVDVPILMLAAKDRPKDRVKGLESGADDYLVRPFAPEELRARLRALLRRPPEWQRVGEITAGPLLVDASRREARVSGTEMGLRKKEFDLLYLLADRQPAVASREEIGERVWGRYVSDNSIDVTLYGLRSRIQEALSENGSELKIETVRGVGYRLVANGATRGKAMRGSV